MRITTICHMKAFVKPILMICDYLTTPVFLEHLSHSRETVQSLTAPPSGYTVITVNVGWVAHSTRMNGWLGHTNTNNIWDYHNFPSLWANQPSWQTDGSCPLRTWESIGNSLFNTNNISALRTSFSVKTSNSIFIGCIETSVFINSPMGIVLASAATVVLLLLLCLAGTDNTSSYFQTSFWNTNVQCCDWKQLLIATQSKRNITLRPGAEVWDGDDGCLLPFSVIPTYSSWRALRAVLLRPLMLPHNRPHGLAKTSKGNGRYYKKREAIASWLATTIHNNKINVYADILAICFFPLHFQLTYWPM